MINRLGIGKTIERLISSIINRFDDGATYFLIDGRFAPSFHRLSRQIIGGDLQHYSIAAASILAKHARDLVMQKMAVRYDSYGFVTNVGYPSPEHLDALDRFGICPVHRMSFRPIAEIAEQKRLWE
ncbi:MAG: Ribonuclease HII [candidate division WS6 bacterium OLB20]|uniref:Ribonuclease n=1 Tax=candidate division WS6 bacterium OLB20 TaxID=1617426 RepID=A0A136LWH2_9BACT|nr:MAG: Ribonuclease HII [candidate division WS6 bacterium OLB20]